MLGRRQRQDRLDVVQLQVPAAALAVPKVRENTGPAYVDLTGAGAMTPQSNITRFITEGLELCEKATCDTYCMSTKEIDKLEAIAPKALLALKIAVQALDDIRQVSTEEACDDCKYVLAEIEKVLK